MSVATGSDALYATQLGLFFQTNNRIPIGLVATFLSELERLVHAHPELGPDATVELASARSGTLDVIVEISTIAANVATAGGAVGAFAVYLCKHLQKKRAKLATTVAALTIDHGVVELKVSTDQGSEKVVTHSLPAVQTLLQKREDKRAIASPEIREAVRAEVDDRAVGLGRVGRRVSTDVAYAGRFELGEDINNAVGRDPIVHFITTRGETFFARQMPELNSDIMFGEPCMVRGIVGGERGDRYRTLFVEEIVMLTEL